MTFTSGPTQQENITINTNVAHIRIKNATTLRALKGVLGFGVAGSHFLYSKTTYIYSGHTHTYTWAHTHALTWTHTHTHTRTSVKENVFYSNNYHYE